MIRIMASVLVVVALSVALARPGAAHEERQLGKYTVEAGWYVEPALEGILNAVFFEVKETAGGREVEGLEATVKVEVTYGGERKVFSPALRVVGGTPGAYVADMIPTKAGDYTFRFTGKIEDLTIDEKFESGPGRFASIEEATDLQFPAKADGAAELTAAQQELRDGLGRLQLIAALAAALAVVAIGLGVFALRKAPRS